jgi:hypothetical protein
MQLSQITKAIVNVATIVVAVGAPILSYTTGILPENVALVIGAIVGAAGAIVHYLAPNQTTSPEVAQTQSVRLKSAKPHHPKRAVS